MSLELMVAVGAIALALAFDFVNGFHDTANSVATVIYTRSLKPHVAIVMSGVLNFLGAVMVGTAVAMVVTKIIPQHTVTLTIVVSVLLGALMWDIATWWFGIPVSSSHCLIGSLFGAGVAANGLAGVDWHHLNKVLLALVLSPVVGFGVGALFTWVSLRLSKEKPGANEKKKDNPGLMRLAHIFSSASVSFTHGSNDGQKTMGIITLVLAAHFSQYGYTCDHVPAWVVFAAAIAIGMGTMIGGWRIIRTVGSKISHERLSHCQGFGASMATAMIIMAASRIGAPISTTHTLTSAVAGGTLPVYGHKKLNLNTVNLIVVAWVLTLPIAAALAAGSYYSLHLVCPF